MQAVDLLISARWVIPVEPAGAVLDDHSVASPEGSTAAMRPAATATQ